MQQEMAVDFMVIDDDPMNNVICKKIIEMALPGKTVHAFILPEDGLNHIMSNHKASKDNNLILFLDINMPVTDGWAVLEQFKKFPDGVRDKTKIFMLSSSVCPEDKNKVAEYAFVSGYINKPLSREKLWEIHPPL